MHNMYLFTKWLQESINSGSCDHNGSRFQTFAIKSFIKIQNLTCTLIYNEVHVIFKIYQMNVY